MKVALAVTAGQVCHGTSSGLTGWPGADGVLGDEDVNDGKLYDRAAGGGADLSEQPARRAASPAPVAATRITVRALPISLYNHAASSSQLSSHLSKYG
ncbi:hypothetical protein ASG57_27670 [Bradyrhizobium sp. Leaf396]|nr:hypothetical protein ASG57_27670 [Bradyrhizobium sp. Leaf396]